LNILGHRAANNSNPESKISHAKAQSFEFSLANDNHFCEQEITEETENDKTAASPLSLFPPVQFLSSYSLSLRLRAFA
jgi:hypothetical protein